MAAVNDLIKQIEDKALRERLMAEVERLTKEKNFGLVFEEHLPEITPLYSAKVRKGCNVALRHGSLSDFWRVLSVGDDKAKCQHITSSEKKEIPIDSLVVVSKLGEPIFPALKPVDKVQNGPEDAPWHTLIEADNYHALQLLEYLYAGQVDCIYIDPPYNSGGQKDWKYNNNYVDKSDSWRHSKWLAMMLRRLKLAKRLLKNDGVLIIAIDENEHAHLICLLEVEFKNHEITTIVVVHNPRGNRENNFTIIHDYAVHVIKSGASTLSKSIFENVSPRKLRRWGHYSSREERRKSFYPIIVKNNTIVEIGHMPDDSFHPSGRNVSLPDGRIEIWPIDDDGIERRWNFGRDSIEDHLNRIIVLRLKNGDIDCFVAEELSQPKSVWIAPELDSGGKYGSSLVNNIVRRKFPYPKSLYTVFKSVSNVVQDRPESVILDFFAGSGTTLHATKLLNALDGGHRRCIAITNNEVSADESAKLSKQGFRPGDSDWEKHGICQSVTWPRSKYTILGKRDDGSELEGEYFAGRTVEKEKSRRFHQIGFISYSELDTAARKK